jgi:tetratricopeptide (TPR) repeat protein
MRSSSFLCRSLGAIGGLLMAAEVADAQDKVILQRASLTARVTVSGIVEEYTGVEVSIRTESDETVKTYPAADVVEIQTAQTESHTRGLKLFAAGQVDQARGELEVALKREPRAWVRREILAALVRCGLRRGDYATAGARFLAILRSDPTSRHFRVIPLVWAPETLTRETIVEAQVWMMGNVEAGRLLGASLLYDDKESGKEARRVLKELSSSTDSRVRDFAQMQAWREAAFTGDRDQMQIARWQKRVDELPEDFRAGPSYLLGRAYAVRHDYELAAAALLWLPLVDDHDFRLAARSCLEAGVALGRIGQHAEAQTLFQEVTIRFADTPFAEEARALLDRGDKTTEAGAGRKRR